VFVSVKDRDKEAIAPIARSLSQMKFQLVATRGTANFLKKAGVLVKSLKKISEGSPNVADYLQASRIDLVINTPSGERPRKDEVVIRSLAVSKGVPCITTIEGARASLQGIEAMKKKGLGVSSLQELHKRINASCSANSAKLSTISA
jgi:carbamoyl-phosphate synthase large subunit